MFCSACGNKLIEGADYCSNCGLKIEWKTEEKEDILQENMEEEYSDEIEKLDMEYGNSERTEEIEMCLIQHGQAIQKILEEIEQLKESQQEYEEVFMKIEKALQIINKR